MRAEIIMTGILFVPWSPHVELLVLLLLGLFLLSVSSGIKFAVARRGRETTPKGIVVAENRGSGIPSQIRHASQKDSR